MSALRELLLPLVAAAILCALAVSLTPEGRGRAAVKLTAGLVMAAAVLRPLAGLSGNEKMLSPEVFQRQAEQARQQGESAAENLRRSLIARELESYIIQQAAADGITVTAQLHLDEEGLPDRITLTGRWTQEEKERLEERITRELGIPADRQIYLDGEGETP